MRKTFINNTEIQGVPVDPLTSGFFNARNWNNQVIHSKFGDIIFSDRNAVDFKIHIRQFIISSRKPVDVEIIDEEHCGASFFISIFDPLPVEWKGFPRRVMKEGNYGLLHLQPEQFKTRLRKGAYALYRITIPWCFLEWMTVEHYGLAHFYARTMERLPEVLFSEPNVFIPWKIITSLKEFIDSPVEEAERMFLLSFFLTGALELLIPNLVNEIKEPEEVPGELYMIERVARMMKSEPAKNYRIAELATHAKMSKISLYRGFRKLYGASPTEFLTGLRMQKAVKLFLNTNDTINKIAIDTGYQHGTGLMKALRNNLNVTPGELRGKNMIQSDN